MRYQCILYHCSKLGVVFFSFSMTAMSIVSDYAGTVVSVTERLSACRPATYRYKKQLRQLTVIV